MSENTIDIKTINNQLNYLKDTKSQLKQALIDKGLPVDDSTPFRDYVSQISNMENVMIFDTLEEMNSTTGVADGTLCIVYKNGGIQMTATEKFKGPIYIPRQFDAGMTIDELTTKMGWWTLTSVSNYSYGSTNSFSIVDDDGNTVVSGSVYCRRWNIVNKSWKYEYTWTFNTSKGTVKYVADTTDNLAETSLYKMSPDIEDAYFCAGGSPDKEYHFVLHTNNHTSSIQRDTTPMVAMFFKAGEMTFDGIYRYDATESCWKPAPTDLAPIDSDVYKGKYMGFDGVGIGTLGSTKYYDDAMIENLGLQYLKVMNMVMTLDTTNITNFCNFYAKLPTNSRFLPFVKVSDKVVDCSNMFHNSYNLMNVSINDWNVDNVTNMSCMFANTSFSGGNLNMINWNMNNATNGYKMFFNSSLSQLYMIGGQNITNMAYMFANAKSNFGNYSLNRFMTNSATNMAYMFANYKYDKLNVRNFSTNNVLDTSYMFYNCPALNYFAQTGAGSVYDMGIYWKAPNSVNTTNMFANCRTMTYINVNGDTVFTPKSQNTSYMFAECHNFKGLTGNQNAAVGLNNTLNASRMFYNCYNLTSRPVYGSLGNCVNTSYMFANCRSMVYNSFNRMSLTLRNVSDMTYMFYGCINLTQMPNMFWNLYNLSNAMFAFACVGFKNLNVINADVPLITNMSQLVGYTSCENILIKNGVFNNMTKLGIATTYTKSITIDNISVNTLSLTNLVSDAPNIVTYKILNMNLDGVTNMYSMLNNCRTIQTFTFPSNFTMGNVTDVSGAFRNCRSFVNLDVLNGKNLSGVTNASDAFRDCTNLKGNDYIEINLPNVENLSSIFSGCTNLINVNIYTNNSSSVKSCSSLFSGCTKLSEFNFDFSTTNCTAFTSMFYNCQNLKSVDTNKLDFTGVTSTYNMFYNCRNLTNLNLADKDMSALKLTYNMFYDCHNLTDLNISNWNLSSITNVTNMFYNCYKISNWDVDNWVVGSNLAQPNMFSYSGFTGMYRVANWDLSNVTSLAGCFNRCNNMVDEYFNDVNLAVCNGANYMFYGCANLNSVTMNNIYAPELSYTSSMFSGCSNLTSVTLSNWVCDKYVNCFTMFYGCNNLTDIVFDNSIKNTISIAQMFEGCSNLSDGAIQNIINWLLSGKHLQTNKVLGTGNSSSPFYRTTIYTNRYSNRLDELRAAGWNV